MKKRAVTLGMAMLALSALAAAGPGVEVTAASLLDRMVSLKDLALAAPAGERVIQFSSYDRKSETPADDPLYGFANRDFGAYLREEDNGRGREYVMAETAGPGAIVRLWSANPGRRTWRIYLDGSAEPVIEARGSDLLAGRVKPWTEPFAGKRNLGGNFCFPIPFARSMKVTVEKRSRLSSPKPPEMYYQVQVLKLPAGTPVRTFAMDQLETLAPRMEEVARILVSPEALVTGDRREAMVELAAGARGELFELAGPAAVTGFEVEVAGKDEGLADVLGRALLTIAFDDENRPAVAVPLGDFFGASPGAPQLNSLAVSIEPTAAGAKLSARWVMPFRDRAKISLFNQSSQRLRLTSRVFTGPWEWTPDSLYFHAAWREQNRIATRPFSDLTMLEAQGRGRFVGLEMNVRNPSELFWWGEGDEKLWVDDDAFPSIFGTGTEDYFGYAWCVQYFKFTSPFHGVTVPTRKRLVFYQALPVPYLWEAIGDATSFQDVVSQYRWQVLDAVPFQNNFRFDMEIWHHRDTAIDVNATAFWYAAPGGADDGQVPGLAAREVWRVRP